MEYRFNDPDWDKKLIKLNGPFLQSAEWASFQESLGLEVARAMGGGWQWQGVVRGQKGLRYLHCSYGPVAKDAAVAQGALLSLLRGAAKSRCDFVRVEPRHELSATVLEKFGGRRISEVQPAHTQILDLTKDLEDLRKGLASGHRNLINGTERRGIVINQSVNKNDLDIFLEMLEDTATRSGVTFFPKSYYQALWEVLQPKGIIKLYLANKGGKPVAAALFYDWNGTRIYAHAGAYQEANREAKASVSLVWQAIVDAKDAGMAMFDLWGVAQDDDPRHKWAGITKFKKGFGGVQVDYAGTWDIPLRRGKYHIYSIYRKIRGRS